LLPPAQAKITTRNHWAAVATTYLIDPVAEMRKAFVKEPLTPT